MLLDNETQKLDNQIVQHKFTSGRFFLITASASEKYCWQDEKRHLKLGQILSLVVPPNRKFKPNFSTVFFPSKAASFNAHFKIT